MYAAAQRHGAFVETMAQFRPTVEVLARLRQLGDAEGFGPGSGVPADWYQRRAVARLRVSPGQRWLDLRAPETREELRTELSALLMALGFVDLDVSRVLGAGRTLTQAIARWAYERGYAGLAYMSRLDSSLILWALFEGVAFEPIGLPEPLTREDADRVATARLFGLVI
jgi:hypothetical protein